MKSKTLFVSFLVPVIFLVSCGGGETKKKSRTGSDEALMAYPIPTALEITQMLNKAGAAYIISVTNDVNNVSRYGTTRAKALNLGVYSADLSYAATYNMQQDMMTFLNAVKLLMEQLEINTPLSQTLTEKLSKLEENKDSAMITITESIKDTYNYLKSNGKEDVALLVMAGGFIEGLYLTVQMAETSPDNTELLKVVSSQKNVFNKLYELIEPYKDDESLKDVYHDFIDLDSFFSKVSGTITQDQLNEIAQLAEKIRNNIIY